MSNDARRIARNAFLILATCFTLLLLARGAMETYAVFLLPLSAEFGWGRTSVSGVYSLAFIVLGTAGPVIGWLFDRFGPVRLYLLGITCLVAAMLLASRATALWQFYLVMGLLLGFGASCVGAVPTAALLSRWFQRRLNSALAVAYSAGGIGIMLLAPTTQYLIDQFGWRTTYMMLAGLLCVALPLALVIWLTRAGDGNPRQAVARAAADRAEPGLTLAQAVRTAAFWGLIWAFCLTGIGMYTVMLQTPAFLTEIGYAPQAAAQAFGLVGILAPAGMIGFGWLGDRIGRRRAILLSYGLTLGGIACLLGLTQGPSLPLLAGFICMFGGTFGCRGPAITTVATTIFRGPHLGRIYGCITIGMGFGGGLGAYFGGFWHDATGGYEAGMIFALTMAALGSLPFILVPAMAKS